MTTETPRLITDHAFLPGHAANGPMCAATTRTATLGQGMCGAPLQAHQHGLLGADARAETICTCAAGDSSPGTDHAAMCALWLPRRGTRHATQRTEHDLLVSLCQLAEEQLTELKRIRAAITVSGGVSSVEVDSNSRAGETKVKTKVYAGSDPPVDEAVAAHAEAMRELTAAQLRGWEDTITALPKRKQANPATFSCGCGASYGDFHYPGCEFANLPPETSPEQALRENKES